MNYESILKQFPLATKSGINHAIKYQDKFNLTLENLKCLNPDCSNMRKWNSANTNFKYCCSPNCTKLMYSTIQLLSKKKASQTYFERTGYYNPGQNPEVINNRNFINSEESINKRKQTCLLKYGVEYTGQIPESRLKAKQTYLMRTGYENAAYNPEVIEKKKQTCLLKYGVEYTGQIPESRKKASNTTFKKYGAKSFSLLHITNFNDWNNKQFWIDNFLTSNQTFDYLKCSKYFNCNESSTPYNQIKKLGIEYTKLGGTSLKEHALYPLLDDLNIKYVTNTKAIIKPMELDIYLPDLKLAIEYNGSYWHSYHPEVGTSPKQTDCNQMKYRHQQKSIACIEAGIRLLHIYEHESEEMLLNKLESFLLYDPETDINNEWDLDTGCYPLGIDYQVMEPESGTILKDRVIWNAGKIV